MRFLCGFAYGICLYVHYCRFESIVAKEIRSKDITLNKVINTFLDKSNKYRDTQSFFFLFR
jgi:hypothetical protein